MNRPAVFFDRDNTLIIGNDYLGDPEKVVLVQGAAEAVARARSMGYATVVVSNQSGVARGMFGEDDVHAVNARMNAMLLAENPDAVIDCHEFCPFHPQAPVAKYRVESDARKPRPGMLLKAAREMELDLHRSWMIGDAPRDIEAGHSAGCRTILFNDRSLPASPAAGATPRVQPDYVAGSLKEAMDEIEHAVPTTPPPESPTTHAKPELEALLSLDRAHEVPPAAEPFRMPSPTAAFEDSPAEAEIAVDVARVPIADRTPSMPEPAEAHPDVLLPLTPSSVIDAPPTPVAPSAGEDSLQASPIRSNQSHLEQIGERILDELRRSREQPHMDFSVSKLLAGIVQVIAVALAFLAYLDRDSEKLMPMLLAAIFFQAMVSSLLIMGRQK